MARIEYHDVNGYDGLPTDYINQLSLQITSASATQVTLQDAEGDGFTITGTNLQYSGDTLIGGTFTGFRIFNAADQTIITGDRFSLDGPAFIELFNGAGMQAALFELLSGRDKILGSEGNDGLFAGNGSDVLLGGGGHDFLAGMAGNDTMTGGKGHDAFVFDRGNDHVLDFQDLGLASDDYIGVTRRMYRNMTVTETATGVDLEFGAKGTLSLDNWTAAEVGRDDFILL